MGKQSVYEKMVMKPEKEKNIDIRHFCMYFCLKDGLEVELISY